MKKEHAILILNFHELGPIRETNFKVRGYKFHVFEHCIGVDFALAHELICRLAGEFEAIALRGVVDRFMVGKIEIPNEQVKALIKAQNKTPVYLANDLERIFCSWTIERLLNEEPTFFFGKKVLFQAATITPFVKEIEEADGKIIAADPLMFANIPVKLHGSNAVKLFVKSMRMMGMQRHLKPFDLRNQGDAYRQMSCLGHWLAEVDVFATYSSMISHWVDFSVLKGKILLIDYLPKDLASRIVDAGVAKIIELVPVLRKEWSFRSFAAMSAFLHLLQKLEGSSESFSDFALDFLEGHDIKPQFVSHMSSTPRTCGFIIHPLSVLQLANIPILSWMKGGPKSLVKFTEQSIAPMPPIRYGKIMNIKSEASGQIVHCNLYGLLATPRQMLRMDLDVVYDLLLKAARMAHDDGCLILGLGAYTKVVGDSGATIAKKASIPITNGNSYTASATIWSAFEMVKALRPGLAGTIPSDALACPFSNSLGEKIKVMVIGATGSIGRVSAKILSLVAKEIVLVAPRPERLLGLRDEIKKQSPRIKAVLSTSPAKDIADCDLIIIATSDLRDKIVDIMHVKPGAVICDCSRPLNISADETRKRRDVMVIQSGEIILPGENLSSPEIGLPRPSVYACLAETTILALEGRYENYSIGRKLVVDKVIEIHRMGERHGARLSTVRGPLGFITEDQIETCRKLAAENITTWFRKFG